MKHLFFGGGSTGATADPLLCHNPILCFLSVRSTPELAKDQIIIWTSYSLHYLFHFALKGGVAYIRIENVSKVAQLY